MRSARGQVGQPLEFNLPSCDRPTTSPMPSTSSATVARPVRIPLVFWDEFDTSLDGRPLGWLRYFLAPMQDGDVP